MVRRTWTYVRTLTASRWTRLLGALLIAAGLAAACERGTPSDPKSGVFTSASPNEFQIAGSSTVSPFVTLAAEVFAANTNYQPPVVESAGTGGGFKLFCKGTDQKTPSISMASRPIRDNERAECEKNSVTDFIELKFGYDGIVLIGSLKDEPVALTRRQLYLALAKDVWIDGAFRANPFKQWSDIESSLPSHPIEVFGPPVSSGTRDAFIELVLEEGAKTFAEIRALETSDPDLFDEKVHTIRTDGVWVNFGENDGQIVQSLVRNRHALGVIGFSYLEQSSDRVRAAEIDGVHPTFETIVSTEYGLSRPLYLYVKTQHFARVPALIPFLREAYGDAAMGVDGYLLDKGLIPLSPNERERNLNRLNRKIIATGVPEDRKQKGQSL